MLTHGLKFFTDIPLTIIGMVLFMLAFLGIAAWIYLPSRSKDFYQTLSYLPLIEEHEHE